MNRQTETRRDETTCWNTFTSLCVCVCVGMAGEERQKRPAAVSLIYTQCPVIGCLREALTLIAHGASVQKHSTIGPRSHFFNAITVHFSVNNKNQRQS